MNPVVLILIPIITLGILNVIKVGLNRYLASKSYEINKIFYYLTTCILMLILGLFIGKIGI